MELTPDMAAVFAGLIALGQGLVRVIERLVDASLSKKKEGDEHLSYDAQVQQLRRVEELHDWHNHDMPNEPGVKVWWTSHLRGELRAIRSSIESLSGGAKDRG